MRQETKSEMNGSPQMAGIVERNIKSLLEKREEEDEKLRWSERAAQRITAFTGSMKFVVLHALLFSVWIIVNLPSFPAIIPKFDPTYVILAMFASVEAIFLSTFILITQNRMMKMADRRAELNLQVNLLAEHEVTRLIHMTAAICSQLGLTEGKEGDIEELTRDVRPEKVLETIEKREHQSKIQS
jgi:uncharacterized membrane protein